MVNLFIRHKVKNYETWKTVFDDFKETRRKGGERSYRIFHPDDDPNNLLLLFQWDNEKNGRKFLKSSALKETMKKAGVLEDPEIYFLDEYEQGKL